jgi:hypothetical protein
MKKVLLPFALTALLLGCAMFGSWRAIPPPGGCDRCHTKPIGGDWQLAFSPVMLTDERAREHWQKPESVLAPQPSPMEQQKITEERCFRCHKEPNLAHREFRGRYHH